MTYLRLLPNTAISSLRVELLTAIYLTTPYDFRYLLKTIINLIICLDYNYEIRALRHSKVFIQIITGNSHYAMNESERKFLNYLIISSFSTQPYTSFEDLL